MAGDGCGREGEGKGKGKEEMGAAVDRGVVRVRKNALAACMTCPICKGLLREATAIVECLHTFCRECIMEKIDDDEIKSCPVCHIDLGCAPEEKLRPDPNIQGIVNKVFPLKGTPYSTSKHGNADIVVSSQPSSLHRKTGKTIDRDDLSKPLKSFLEARGARSCRTVPINYAAVAKGDRLKSRNAEFAIRKDGTVDKVAITGTRESTQLNWLKLNQESNGKSSVPEASEDKSITNDQMHKPVWFSLVQSSNKKEAKLVPQLPKNYLRIKDGRLQVSSIQKYIMNKLALASSDEVEIVSHGKPICPSTTLYGLVDLYLSREPAKLRPAVVGAPAKEFVMELSYRRRRRPGVPSLCCISFSPEYQCHCSNR